MRSASEIFDSAYSYGAVDESSRSVRKQAFIDTVDAYLSLPRAMIFQFDCDSDYRAAFAAFGYGSETERVSLRVCVYGVSHSGSIVYATDSLFRTRTVMPDRDLVAVMAELQSRWVRTFTGSPKDFFSTASGGDGPRVGSLSPYGRNAAFFAERNAETYSDLTAPYFDLTKSGAVGRARTPSNWKFGKVVRPESYACASVFRQFRSEHLDSNVLHVMARLGVSQETSMYNWLGGAGVTEAGVRRCQAALSYPIFVPVMRSRQVTSAIDDGASLLVELAKEVDILPGQLKLLRGITNQISRLTHGEIIDLCSLVRSHGRRAIPATRLQWGLFKQMFVHDGAFVSSVMQSGYASVHHQLQKRSLTFFDAVNLVRDVIDAVRADDYGKPKKLIGLVYKKTGEIGFCRWLEISDAYHTQSRQISNRTRQEISDAYRSHARSTHWPCPFADQVIGRSNDVTLRWLTDPLGVEREGAEMGHCVANYVGSCMQGRCHIASLSFQRGQDTYRATAEFLIEGNKVKLRQLYSQWNDPPHPAIDDAVRGFMRRVADGQITVDFDAYRLALAQHLETAEISEKIHNRIVAKRDAEIGAAAWKLMPPSIKAAVGRPVVRRCYSWVKVGQPEARFGYT